MNGDTVRALCADWPGVDDGVKWGNDLVFTVGGRMFCVLDLGKGDGKAGRLSFKVDIERFLEYTDLPGIQPAPYLARAQWVSLDPPDDDGRRALPAAALEAAIRRSYELVFARLPKRQQRQLLGQG